MRRWLRLAVMITAGIFVVSLLGIACFRIPRGQLAGQSMGNLTGVIRQYIRAHGRMPAGLEQLTEQGLLRRTESGQYQVTCLPKEYILYHLDDITVNWTVRIEDLTIQNGQVVFRNSGEPMVIIRQKPLLLFPATNAGCSVAIYQELCAAVESGSANNKVNRSQ